MGFLSVSGKLSPVTWTSRLLCTLASTEVMDATSERRGQKHMDIIRHSTGSRGHWTPQHASQLCSSDRVSSLTLPGTQLRHWTCPCSAHVSGEQPGNEMTPPTWRNTKDHLKGRAEPKKRPCMLSLLPAGTTHRGWQDAYGKTYTFFCSLSGLPAASSTCRNSRLLLKL